MKWIRIIIVGIGTHIIIGLRKKEYKYFYAYNNYVEIMSSFEENIKKHNRDSKEITRANSRLDFSSRIMNSPTNFTNSL